ncbi:MAG: type I-C CRISPR-associated protein Cas8c/Csd1 [Propionibacteriaceae bacterium]|nr:type I-C CRISPR-associated protein Cas8c/Csd1 [Propionibacteriaceae bacterium]
MSTLYQALVRYADDHQLLARPYYADLRALWQLDLNADGSLASRHLTAIDAEPDKNGNPGKVPGRIFSSPTMKRTSGIAAILGADGLDYVLGWHEPVPDDPAAEAKARADSAARHAAWADLMRAWAASPLAAEDAAPQAVARFLDDGVRHVERPAKWGAKDRVRIRVNGHPVTDSASAAAFWAQHVEAKKTSDRRGFCLVCSRYATLVATLPQSVKGTLIPDGHTSGVAPISINEAVYGFDLRKGLGQVPVCVACAQAIPVALENLLASTSHTHRTPRSATTWWIEGTAPIDFWSWETPASDSDVRELIHRIAAGSGTDEAEQLDHFHALTLEANGPRLVVRDWTHMPLTELQDNILGWFRDTRIVPLWPNGREYQSLGLMALSTGRHEAKANQYRYLSDKAGRHPHRVTETLREVALQGRPLPRDIAAHVLQRIIADQNVDDPRAALLQLFLTRSTAKGTDMPGLDPTNQDPSYLLGRLMAVYENMQYAAATASGGDAPNATFADKFMAGAITSPILILTSGAKQAQGWRAKLRRANRSYFFDQTIDSIASLLEQTRPAPTRATIEEQASFLLGYHHQRASDNHARQAARSAKAAAAEDTAAENTDNTASDDDKS